MPNLKTSHLLYKIKILIKKNKINKRIYFALLMMINTFKIQISKKIITIENIKIKKIKILIK